MKLVMKQRWRVPLIKILEKLENFTSKNSSIFKRTSINWFHKMIKNLRIRPTRIWLPLWKSTVINVPESSKTSTLEKEFFTRELDRPPSTNMLIRCTIMLPERLKITWSNKPRLSSSHQKQTLTNTLVTSIPSLMMVMMMETSVMKSLNLMLENSMKCGLRLRTITQLRSKDFLN